MRDGELPLNRLPIGRAARVTALRADGPVRRRLLDLGIVEGTLIRPLFRSPSGNPVAYRIRGAVIALRTDASSRVLVSAPKKEEQGGV
jgi:ferrous iron transport protein A